MPLMQKNSKLSEMQKQIASLLMHSPKTAEELAKALAIPYSQLMNELKELLRLKLIKRQGYPTYYSLSDKIAGKVKERTLIKEKDPFSLRLKIIIEAKAIEEEFLKKQLSEIEEALRKEKPFTIYDIQQAPIIKEEEYYSSFLDIDLSVADFRAIVNLMFYYGPVSVEVLRPEKIELSVQDLQDALMDLSEIVHAYADYIRKMMSRQELEEFTRKLFEKKH